MTEIQPAACKAASHSIIHVAAAPGHRVVLFNMSEGFSVIYNSF